MFGAIWAWAGSYRATERNIGVDPRHIAVTVRDLVEDVCVWFENERPFSPAVRFHHRLVQIHSFPDGNGRHARLATDACLRACGEAPFTRDANLVDVPMRERRQRYHAALRAAGCPEPLR
jgi:fido (protein-threonine AMPylation protein)